jgi:ABC-type nickel/cobalt efflux system permease component RcnA
MGRHRRSLARRLFAAMLAVGLVAVVASTAAAHPLGNFTINHYAGIRVEVDRILLDVVIDHAEIPTFQARQDFDLDADGSLSDDEVNAGRVGACESIAPALTLTLGGGASGGGASSGELLPLELSEAGLSFPLGAGGLSTMRQVCTFTARLADPIGAGPVRVGFTDGTYAERLGWREIVVAGSGVTLRGVTGELRRDGVSDRLLRYPEARIASPLADASVVVEATAGGPSLAAFDVPDAQPVPVAAAPSTEPSIPPPSPAPTSTGEPVRDTPDVATVPGGIGTAELPEIFRRAELTPLIALVALATAAALGAGHALTPGHGKTLMAAYLVGTRGTARHALGLGAAVSVSHTAGILVLAAIVVAATDVLAPDVVVRWAPVVAAISILVIGGWMLLGEIRRRRLDGRHARDHAHPHPHGHEHPHPHTHGHEHDHGDSHGHGPASTISWRGLFALGLAGGLIPSTSALLILLGSIAAGRPAFGLVLVVAFGLGMAAVMAGVGLALVAARDRIYRVGANGGVGRLGDAAPLAAAVVVLGFGLVLTVQALTAIGTTAL